MDARKMKKVIQYEALSELKSKLLNEGLANEGLTIGEMIDKDRASFAQIRRFQKVLDEMIKDAEAGYFQVWPNV